MLDLSGLKRTVEALERSLSAAHDERQALSEEIREAIRSGVIQNFEVAYEQCWKYIQRWIRVNRTVAESDYPRSRKELFRLAARLGLIADPSPWFEYGDARNLTAHTYNEADAIAAYEMAERFLPDARALVEWLANHND